MWLLKFHLCVSILCLITFVGFAIVFKKSIEQNGWGSKKYPLIKRMIAYLAFFVPVLNMVTVLGVFIMIFITKEDLDRTCGKEAGDPE